MQFHSELEYSTIRRLYEQGLDSIARLVSKLEDRILRLEDLQLSDRARTVETLSEQIKLLQQTLEHKSQQLIQVHQLNHALLLRIRELEHCLESDDDGAATDAPKRDSHNSSLSAVARPAVEQAQANQKFTEKVHSQSRCSTRSSRRDSASSQRPRPPRRLSARAVSALSRTVTGG